MTPKAVRPQLYLSRVKKLALAGSIILAATLITCAGPGSRAGGSDEYDESADGQEQVEEGAASSNLSERGHIVKEFGEAGSIGEPAEVEFNVAYITLDFECTTDWGFPPENGNFVALGVNLEVSATAKEPFAMESDDAFRRFIGPDGIRANSIATPPTNSCIPEVDKLPNSIGVGESEAG